MTKRCARTPISATPSAPTSSPSMTATPRPPASSTGCSATRPSSTGSWTPWGMPASSPMPRAARFTAMPPISSSSRPQASPAWSASRTSIRAIPRWRDPSTGYRNRCAKGAPPPRRSASMPAPPPPAPRRMNRSGSGSASRRSRRKAVPAIRCGGIRISALTGPNRRERSRICNTSSIISIRRRPASSPPMRRAASPISMPRWRSGSASISKRRRAAP